MTTSMQRTDREDGAVKYLADLNDEAIGRTSRVTCQRSNQEVRL